MFIVFFYFIFIFLTYLYIFFFLSFVIESNYTQSTLEQLQYMWVFVNANSTEILYFFLPQAGLLALLAVAEHAGEFEKIISLSQR